MTNFSTVRETLIHNQHLHGRIAQFYRQLASKTNNHQAEALLQVLAKHESELMTFLGEYIEKASAKVLDTFYQFDREQYLESLFISEVKASEVSCDMINSLAQRIEQYFRDIYQQMADANDNDEVKALFDNLRQHMEQQQKRLSININSLQDI